MSTIATSAKFLKISEDDLKARAAEKGVNCLSDTYLTPEQMVHLFGFEPAGIPAEEKTARTRTVLTHVTAFLAMLSGAFFFGYLLLYPLPEWLSPKPSAMIFSMLGYLFWGIFCGVWGHLILYRAFKRKLLLSMTNGLVLCTTTEGREAGGHRALFVRVSVLYRACGKVFAGDEAVVGKTVRSFKAPLPRNLVLAAAAYPEGMTVPVYYDPNVPVRFSLKRQLGLKLLSAVSGAAVCGVSMFFASLAGAVARSLSA